MLNSLSSTSYSLELDTFLAPSLLAYCSPFFSFLYVNTSWIMQSIASNAICLRVCTLQLTNMSKWAISIFHIPSILDIFTNAVSTNRVIPNVFMLANTSLSFGWFFAPPFYWSFPEPEITVVFWGTCSKIPTVSCPREVMSSYKDWLSKRRELVKRLSKESCNIWRSLYS